MQICVYVYVRAYVWVRVYVYVHVYVYVYVYIPVHRKIDRWIERQSNRWSPCELAGSLAANSFRALSSLSWAPDSYKTRGLASSY